MKCKYVRSMLEEYLEGEFESPDVDSGQQQDSALIKDIEEHLEACAECRKELMLLRQDRKLLGDALRPHRLPRDFTDKVMSAISEQRGDAPTHRRPHFRLRTLLCAAAALLLATTLTFIVVSMSSSPTESPRKLSVARAPSKATQPRVQSAANGVTPHESLVSPSREAETAAIRLAPSDTPGPARDLEKTAERAGKAVHSPLKVVEIKEQAKREAEVQPAPRRGEHAADLEALESDSAREASGGITAGRLVERVSQELAEGNVQRAESEGHSLERAAPTPPAFAAIDVIAGSLAYRAQTDQTAPTSWRWGLVGESLSKGATIKTGPSSFASLSLADGSQLKLNGGTRISFLAPTQLGGAEGAKKSGGPDTPPSHSLNAIKLDRGDVWLRVAKSTPSKRISAKGLRRLEISSTPAGRLPYAIITDKAEVRITGTTLAVSASPRETTTSVTEGKVVVSGNGKETALEAGQMGIVSDTVTATAPIRDATKDLAWTAELAGVAHSSRPAAPHRRSLASIGHLDAKDPSTGEASPVSIKQLHVNVEIKDQIAKTTIEEVFFNAADRQLEGVFYFPLPPGASISRLAMYIGDELMEGEIVERERAREVYEEIVRTMRDPALLEWERGDIFKCRVFPIPPRGEKRIILSYTQVLVSDYGRVQYVYPMAVEPIGGDAEGAKRRRMPGLAEGPSPSNELAVLGEIKLNVAIESAPEIKAVYSPSHECDIVAAEHSAKIAFSARSYRPDSDFILNYQIAKNGDEVFALPYREADNEDGCFMLRLLPDIEMSDPPDLPKDYLFVVDASGSVSWREYKAEVEVVKTLLNEMSMADRFNVVYYDVTAKRLDEDFIPCTPDNRDKAVELLNSVTPSGASDIVLAFENVSELLGRRRRKGRSACVFFISDGIATAGRAVSGRPDGFPNDQDLEDEIKRVLANAPPSIYAIAVGREYDAGLLGWMAREFNGELRRFSLGQDVAERAFELAISLTRPTMRDVRITVDDSVIANLSPQSLSYVYQGQEIISTGVYKRPGKTTITLSGTVKDKKIERKYEIDLPEIAKENVFVPRLWARRYIGLLLDQINVKDPQKAPINKIIELSKEYSIMTPFTSLLVLESEKQYEKYEIERRKKKEYWKAGKKRGTIAQAGRSAASKPKASPAPRRAASKGTRALGPRTLAEKRAAARARDEIVWKRLRRASGITFPGGQTTLEDLKALISPLSEVAIIIDPDAQSAQGTPIADTPFTFYTVSSALTFEDILDLATDALSSPPKDEVWWVVKNMAVFITDKDGYKRYLRTIRPIPKRAPDDFGWLTEASETTMPVRDFSAEDVQRNIDKLGMIEGKDHFTVLSYNGGAEMGASFLAGDSGTAAHSAVAGVGARSDLRLGKSVRPGETRLPSFAAYDRDARGLARRAELQTEGGGERGAGFGRSGAATPVQGAGSEMMQRGAAGTRSRSAEAPASTGGGEDAGQFGLGVVGIKDGPLLILQTEDLEGPSLPQIEVGEIVEAWNKSARASKTSEAQAEVLAVPQGLEALAQLDKLTVNELREVKDVVDGELQLRAYAAGVRKAQRDPNFYRRAARVLASRGDWGGALRAFSTVVEIDPQDASVHQELAELYQSRKLYEKALEELKTALKLEPDEEESYTAISRLALAWGKPDIIEDAVMSLAGNLVEADIKVMLSWDTDETDVDLCVVDPSGEKCSHSHTRTKSGGRLFADVTTGRGPELFIQQKAIPGDYRIIVHYYSEGGAGETKCKVVVVLHAGAPGEERKEYQVVLTKKGDQKEIATFTFTPR